MRQKGNAFENMECFRGAKQVASSVILNRVIHQLKEWGVPRIGIVSGSILFSLFFVIFLSMRVSQQDMSLLYGDLDLREGGQITEKLQSVGVQFDVRDGGKQIYVPTNELLKLRMLLAEAGLPNGGGVGYEIFDRSDVLGSTSFIQNVNFSRAVEGEISRTIRTLQGVVAARVHLAMPKKVLFSKDNPKASAAVVVKMRAGADRLSGKQVKAIQHLLASSVPGLTTENISILDDRGLMLTSGAEKGTSPPLALNEARITYETRLARMIESLLEQSVGLGKIRAEVTAELNMDHVTEKSEIFDPQGQIPRSVHNTSRIQRSADNESRTPTSVQSNMPNPSPNAGRSNQSNESQQSEETTNYEISKTIKTAVREVGSVKRLSVAVLVDGLYEKDLKGQEMYQPRSPEELAQLTKFVKAIVGFQAERGDVVDVLNLKFVRSPVLPSAEESFWGSLQMDRGDWIRVIEAGILGFVTLLLLFFVLRPALKRTSKSAETPLIGNGHVSSEQERSSKTLSENGMEDVEVASPPTRVEKLRQIESFVQNETKEATLALRIWMKQ